MTPDSGAQTPAEPPADEDPMRERFRAALERKHAQHAAGSGANGDRSGGAHPHTGPAKTQRTFRRKSG